MPRPLKRGKCTIISIIDNITNKPYTDNWRENYIGTIGHAVIEESIHKCPGDNMLYFENENRYIYTSPGKLILETESEVGKSYKLVTKNSTYKFIMSDIQEIQPSLFNKEDKTYESNA